MDQCCTLPVPTKTSSLTVWAHARHRAFAVGVALVPYQDLELQLPWEDWFPLLPPDGLLPSRPHTHAHPTTHATTHALLEVV
jgi:hypothetical protein